MKQVMLFFSLVLFYACSSQPTNVSEKDVLRNNLSPLAYNVTQEGGTETAFTGEFWDHKLVGTYHCLICDQELFSSSSKFKSGTGWPSYYEAINDEAVSDVVDNSGGYKRTESVCSNCKSHLGHVFKDGPPPTGLRYCINSVALTFKENNVNEKLDTMILGAGCFWCIEAFFQEIKGVQSVDVGYMGGDIENPSYEQVCSGLSGHAEVAKIVFDSTVVTRNEILQVFFLTHDPTTLNRQGADKGTQYRSVVFYEDQEEKKVVENLIQMLNENEVYSEPIVTTLEEESTFYVADKEHQSYYLNNQESSYCTYVIIPKLKKYQAIFDKINKSK